MAPTAGTATRSDHRHPLRTARAVGVLHGLLAVGALAVAGWCYLDWALHPKGDYSGLAFLVVLPGLALGAPLLALSVATFSRSAPLALGVATVVGLVDLVAALTWAVQVVVVRDEITALVALLVLSAVALPLSVCVVTGRGLASVQRDLPARLVTASRVLLALHATAGAALALFLLPVVVGLTDEPASSRSLDLVLLGLAPVVAAVVALRSQSPRTVHALGAGVATATAIACVAVARVDGTGASVLVGLLPALALGAVSLAGLQDDQRAIRHAPSGV